MTYYIFREPSPGIVAHTSTSKLLSEMPMLRQLVGFMAGEMAPSASRMVDAMQKWPGSEEPNESVEPVSNGSRVMKDEMAIL